MPSKTLQRKAKGSGVRSGVGRLKVRGEVHYIQEIVCVIFRGRVEYSSEVELNLDDVEVVPIVQPGVHLPLNVLDLS